MTCAVTQGPVLRRALLGSKLCCHHFGIDNNFSKRAAHLILHWTLQITKLVLPVAIPFVEDWPRLPSRTRLPLTRESTPTFSYLSPFVPRLLESDDKNLTEKPMGTPSFTLYMFTGVLKKTPQTLLCWGLGLQTAVNSLLPTLIKGMGSVNNSEELMRIPSSVRQRVAFLSAYSP